MTDDERMAGSYCFWPRPQTFAPGLSKRLFRRNPRWAGFTLIELLVVIAIISLLVSILLPSLSRAKLMAEATVCRGNMRALGVACAIYAEDHNDYVPRAVCDEPAANGDGWLGRLLPYVGVDGVDILHSYGPYFIITSSSNYAKLIGTVYDCPSVPGPIVTSGTSIDNWYRFNYAMCVTPNLVLSGNNFQTYRTKYSPRQADIPLAAETIIIGEVGARIGDPFPLPINGSYTFAFYSWYSLRNEVDYDRHGRGCEWAFYDGHSEEMDSDQFWETGFYYGRGWVN